MQIKLMEKRKVIMHIEGVPNPNAMKFVLENGVLVDQPYEFEQVQDAHYAPLARKLLMLRYVNRVMLNANYVTVVKHEQNAPVWDQILYELRMLIQQHLEQDEPIIYYGVEPLQHGRSDDVVVGLITDLLDKHIRPAAQADGGDIVFDSYEKGVLNLSMHGACHLCPHAIQTMKKGVEPVIKSMIPEVNTVIAKENRVL